LLLDTALSDYLGANEVWRRTLSLKFSGTELLRKPKTERRQIAARLRRAGSRKKRPSK
jgi:hypothetical protein